MILAVHYWIIMHFGSLENIQEARVALSNCAVPSTQTYLCPVLSHVCHGVSCNDMTRISDSNRNNCDSEKPQLVSYHPRLLQLGKTQTLI